MAKIFIDARNVLDLIRVLPVLAVFTLLLYLVQNEVVRYKNRVKGLSGPRGLPVIGNLHQLREIPPSETYRLWAKDHGPVYQIQLGNTTVVVVNSAASAKRLFLSQGSALNSRPVFHVFHTLVTKSVTSIGTSPWNESVKARRKAAAGALNKAKTESYFPLTTSESRYLIQEILAEGSKGDSALDYHPIVQHWSLNLVLALNYGSRLGNSKDGLAQQRKINHIEGEISKFRSVSSNLSNYIPILRIAGILKGENKEAAAIGRQRELYNENLLAELKERISNGTDVPCIQGNVLKDPTAKLSPDELTSISLSMMAGSETNTPTLEWACIFLSRNPSIQRKAYQAIVDQQGSNFDPLLDDEVPYVYALNKELLRWYTPLRLAMPRQTYTDASWEGVTIPKGTTVYLNAWACNRDEEMFKDPYTFAPERWMNESDAQGLTNFSFGYGQRMCVASHLAVRAVYVALLQLIANFEILKGDDQGSELGEDWYDEFVDPIKGVKDPLALSSRPHLVPLRFVPRDARKLEARLEDA